MQEPSSFTIERAVQSILSRERAQILSLDQAALKGRWSFRWDERLSAGGNIYRFNQALDSYRHTCRIWEEHHGGVSCVVERVRDTYLMPRIHDFETALLRHYRDSQP